MNKYEILKSIIEKSHNIVIFTGAGISKASGIPDFRSSDGLYKQKGYIASPEEILSHHFLEEHTDEFYDFYKKNMIYTQAEPNLAHKYIAKLEKMNKNVTVITQNIDGLHEKAGNSNVLNLHGTVFKNHCVGCGRFFGVDYILKSQGIPVCDKCGEIVKPDVVLYEEELDAKTVEKSINAILNCDTLLVIGTSLTVYPAAGFIRYFRGQNLVVINKERTNYDNMCDLVINEDIIKVIEEISK